MKLLIVSVFLCLTLLTLVVSTPTGTGDDSMHRPPGRRN